VGQKHHSKAKNSLILKFFRPEYKHFTWSDPRPKSWETAQQSQNQNPPLLLGSEGTRDQLYGGCPEAKHDAAWRHQGSDVGRRLCGKCIQKSNPFFEKSNFGMNVPSFVLLPFIPRTHIINEHLTNNSVQNVLKNDSSS
jgi:hypothetical protein